MTCSVLTTSLEHGSSVIYKITAWNLNISTHTELSLFARVVNPKAERNTTSIFYWNLMEYQIASDMLLSQTKLSHPHTLGMCSSYCSWKAPHALFPDRTVHDIFLKQILQKRRSSHLWQSIPCRGAQRSALHIIWLLRTCNCKESKSLLSAWSLI